MKMNSTLQQLTGLLEQETDLYRSMLVVVDEERTAAVQSDLNALNATRVKKEKILDDLQQKETQRRQLVASLAEHLGCAAQELTLTKISQLVDEPHAANLSRVSKDFSSVLARLQASSRRNRQIVEHSLELLRGTFNLLNEFLSPNTIYYRTGNMQSIKSTGKCVCSNC